MSSRAASQRDRNDTEHTVIAVDQDGSTTASPGSREPGRQASSGPATPGSVRIDHPDDRARAGEARQEAETDELAAAFPVGVVTHGQAKGAIVGGIIGLVVGAALGALLGLIPIQDASVAARLGAGIGIGGFAGLIVGIVFGGGWQSDREEKPREADPAVVVGYDTDRPAG